MKDKNSLRNVCLRYILQFIRLILAGLSQKNVFRSMLVSIRLVRSVKCIADVLYMHIYISVVEDFSGTSNYV